MASIIHLAGKDSKTFNKVIVRDIGRRSELMSITGDYLEKGKTFASFHWFGTCAWQMDALNRAVTGSESSIEKL